MSVAAKPQPENLHRNNSRLTRAKHHHKPSHSDASDKELALDNGPRASHDSQRKLHLSHQTSSASFGSGRLEDSTDLTHARYQNKFTQDWAVPDFGRPKRGTGEERMFTTSVERAEVPYDHLRALEK
jgi:hypothetical protein